MKHAGMATVLLGVILCVGAAFGTPYTLPNVPAYDWYHGCGPTAAASILGYYDLHGCDNLFDASGWSEVRLTSNVQDQISSPEHNAKYDPTPDDTSLPTPAYTSIADWFRTSRDPLGYGGSYQYRADDALEGYAKYRGYSSANSWYESYGAFTWTDLVNEIDAGRPMMFLVDSSGDGGTDHFVPVLGYDDRGDNGKYYGFYTTWSESETIRWERFRGMSDDYTWGVAYGTYLSIPFTQPNHVPVAVADAFSLDEDGSLSILAAEGVLANDTDDDDDPLIAIQVTDTAHGTLTLYSSGALSYTPDADYHGTDSFYYRANDGTDDSNAARVLLTIESINDVPVAEDDFYQMDQGGSMVLYGYEGVLANDYDVDSSIEAILASDVANGTLDFYASGGLKYTPDGDFSGTDTFTYWAYDGEAYSELTTVSIDVVEAMIPIPGDATGDGKVDQADATVVAQNWGQPTEAGAAAGDFNGDGTVDMADASIMAANWGFDAGETATVPEPSTLVLLLTLASGLLGPRRRKR